MNPAVASLLTTCPGDHPLRWRFALACVERVQHLIESAEVMEQLAVLQGFVNGICDREMLEQAAIRAAHLARRHPGSVSIDGAAHAAVSATHAVAKALAGRAEETADYAAYAAVYAYASHAVTSPEAFAGEHAWQQETWLALVNATTCHPSVSVFPNTV